MKKIIITVICVILALLLLVPIPMRLKDGGTVEYTALLYKVSKVHSFASTEEMEAGKPYHDGLVVELLGREVFNNVK